MKLNPPASSSDLDAARDIARRLHQRRRRDDRPGEQRAGGRLSGPQPASSPRPAPFAPAPPAPPPSEETSPRPLEPSRARPFEPLEPRPFEPPEPRPFEPPAPEPIAPPTWDEPGGPDAPALDALDALTGLGEPAVPQERPRGVDVDDLDVDVEEPAVSPEEMVGMPEGPSLEDLAAGGEPVPPSPFDVDLDDSPAEAEDMVEVSGGPSWDDVVVACLDVSKARGAMLVDPAGQIFASRGEWPPEPGPEAIARKLVSMLDRTLKDSPTRSISAPLMGKHLTAWRVPLADGLVTAAFIGDSPVKSEARPAIDAEIRRGPGA